MSKLPCEPDQWPTFSRLLYAALDLPLDERAAWLDSLATELACFRPGLSKVLECAELPDASQFLNRPVIAVVEDSEFAPGQRTPPGVGQSLTQGDGCERPLLCRHID
jgi:hypothetical protein